MLWKLSYGGPPRADSGPDEKIFLAPRQGVTGTGQIGEEHREHRTQDGRWPHLPSTPPHYTCDTTKEDKKRMQHKRVSYHITYHISYISYIISSYHISSYHITSHHIIYHITSHHIISYHIISYHIIYHIISYLVEVCFPVPCVTRRSVEVKQYSRSHGVCLQFEVLFWCEWFQACHS
jgi:hypothetical protein